MPPSAPRAKSKVKLAPPIDLPIDVFDAPGPQPLGMHGPHAQRELREIFWCNVVREMLTNLSMLSYEVQKGPARKGARLREEVFDGRVAVITRRGRRVGIAQVTPLFACGVPGSTLERDLSMAVECTVFKIVTPEGEVWTLPLSEIRAVHALSEDLVKRLQQEARPPESAPDDPRPPFGFAAFTSLAQTVKGAPGPRAGKGRTRPASKRTKAPRRSKRSAGAPGSKA